MADGKADKIEVLRRVRQVMEWILDGYQTCDIVKSCTAKYDIEERMAYKYIKQARDQFVAATKGEQEELLAVHVAARYKLFQGLKGKDFPDGVSAGLNVLKDIAKLQGLYTVTHVIQGDKDNPVKHDHKFTVEVVHTGVPFASSEEEISV